MEKFKRFLKKYTTVIAASLCFISALIGGYVIQKNEIEKENLIANETQAFITESEDKEVLQKEEGKGQDKKGNTIIIPEAFPDDGNREPIVTEEDVLSSPVASLKSFNPVMPVSGGLSKSFSENPLYSVTMDDWRSHEAIDITCQEGENVYAAEKGTVTKVGIDSLMGVYIRIDHQNGFETIYSNLHPETTVCEGQEINKEHQIGYVGSTSILEQEESPHLHFELLKDGKRVNPTEYIKK